VIPETIPQPNKNELHPPTLESAIAKVHLELSDNQHALIAIGLAQFSDNIKIPAPD